MEITLYIIRNLDIKLAHAVFMLRITERLGGGWRIIFFFASTEYNINSATKMICLLLGLFSKFMRVLVFTFFQIYLEVRFIWRRIWLLLPTLQLGAICLGCWVSISRISDNKHHVGDVVAGALIGAAGTLFTVCIFPNCVTYVTTTKITNILT